MWRKRFTRPPAQRRDGGSQFGILVGKIVGLRDCIDRRPDDGVVDRLLNQIAHQKDPQLASFEAFDVIGTRPDRVPGPGRPRCDDFLIHLDASVGASPVMRLRPGPPVESASTVLDQWAGAVLEWTERLITRDHFAEVCRSPNRPSTRTAS